MDVAHLSYREKTNLGSFYTPARLVEVAYGLFAQVAGTVEVVLDSSCGYGAFFSVPFPQKNVRLVGADIDEIALDVAAENFSRVRFLCENALKNINREKYGISPRERLVIVGNPPYNDVTSRVKNHIKHENPCEMESDIRTRDLGISFLLSFEKLSPEYVVVLHPLSYLIKQANFKLLEPFMRKYALRKALVLNSREFSDTSKSNGFPIVVAVYERNTFGTTYADIVRRRFMTLEGISFSVSDYDYVCRYIPKYPSRVQRRAGTSRYKFFTMRDVNALKRSRTFISDDTANTIYIPTEKLELYCYVDIFKDYSQKLPYFLGNFDVMINREEFEKIKNDFLVLSIEKHPEIFREEFLPVPKDVSDGAFRRVDFYFKNLFKGVA